MRYTLPIAPTLNHYLGRSRDGRVFKTSKARQWERDAGYVLLSHKKYGARKVTVTLETYMENNRSDLGNRAKIVLDLLEKQGIIDNDNQVFELHEYKFLDPDDPRIEMEVSEYVER